MTEILVATPDGVAEAQSGRVDLDGRDVGALAVRDSEVVAVVDHQEVWRRQAGRWNLEGRLRGDSARCLAVGADAVWIGHAGARLTRLSGGEEQEVPAFDEAPGRSEWYTPWGGPPDVRSIAVDDGEVFVNVHVGGILRSADGGATWEPDLPVDDDAHEVVVAPEGRLVAPTGARGLAVGGRGEWGYRTAGLHGTYLRAAAVSDATIVVSASTGPFTDRAGIYRTPLDGHDFERCRHGLPEWFDGNVDSHWLAARGATVALAAPDGSVYQSLDGGGRWEKVAEGFSDPRAVLVV